MKVRAPGLLHLVVQGLRRPAVLPVLVRASWRFRGQGWWRRWPFLPLPPQEYMEWRLHTAYGDSGAPMEFDDVERYLRWVVQMNRGR